MAELQLKDAGYQVVILSSRALYPNGKQQIQQWLEIHGAPDVTVTSEKVPALVYVDDRAKHFDSWQAQLPELDERAAPCGHRLASASALWPGGPRGGLPSIHA